MALRKGMKMDGWTLIKRLGGGGSSSVWRARHEKWGEAALKLLTKTHNQRAKRFADEIKVMQQLGNHPGVLPLIAAKLPDEDSAELAWLASPVAHVVDKALGRDPDLMSVGRAVLAYARTLADLASQGIGHRDIKPANLFHLDGQWLVGDFGLAAYPEKEAITGPAARVGPLYFMAPEMLREPDKADPGPADVFSLAKTHWALATSERYPPEGQIRAELRGHDLRGWIEEPGALALGALLESATEIDPGARPPMVDFADALERWLEGGGIQDDRAAGKLRRGHVERLMRSLRETVDEEAIPEIEALIQNEFAEAKRSIERRRQEAQVQAFREAEDRRKQLVEEGQVKQLLRIVDSAWTGSMRDGRDLAETVLAHPPEQRTAQLQDVQRMLLGRPLWWLHSVVLCGALRLRGEDGCEPLASELAAEGARNHLLEFRGHWSARPSWRLQRALIPAIARLFSLAPFDQFEEEAKSLVSAEGRLRLNFDSSRLFIVGVSEVTRKRLLAIDPWTPESLTAAAQEAEEMLKRVPIPKAEWKGPVTDPWLLSWQETSPVLLCGLAILGNDPGADDLLVDEELREAITEAAHEGSKQMQPFAKPLAVRLGLIADDEAEAGD